LASLLNLTSGAPTSTGAANPFAAWFGERFALPPGTVVGTTSVSSLPGATAAEQRANAATMYAAQLDTLAHMGFVDRESNLTALIQSSGSVEAAMDYILRCSSS